MPRIRTVKPEFYTHYELFAAEQDTGLPLRLAYSGLWLCADKEGRFRWQPKQLKLFILPYDEVDFDGVLAALIVHGFIKKYQVDGNFYGWIPTLKIHQRFSGTEATTPSKLPSPQSGSITEALRNNYGSTQENHNASVLEDSKNLNNSLPDNNDEEALRKHLGSTSANWKGGEERSKGKGKGKGKEEEEIPAPEKNSSLIYDIEKELLSNKKIFEAICMKQHKDAAFALNVLKKYHLFLQEKEAYPKSKTACYAGFEKWLMNEKQFLNGTEKHQRGHGGRAVNLTEPKSESDFSNL